MAEYGSYIGAAASLNATTAAKADFADNAGFSTLGWSPEGQVYFSYGVGGPDPGTTDGAGVTTGATGGYFATAEADIDGDGNPQAWGYQKTGATAAAEHTCASLAATDQVGPCVTTHGQSIF